MNADLDAAQKFAKRTTHVVDVYLRLTPDLLRYRGETDEQFVKRLEEWGRDLEAFRRDLEAFLRDHRSQDRVSVYVHRDTEAVCDQCGKPWELRTEDGKTMCAYCGAEVAP